MIAGFFDYQPKTELAQSLSAADLQLVLLDPLLTNYLMPSKLCSALAAGSFVVAVTDASCELARIVDEEGVGVVTPPDEAATLASVISEYVGRPDVIASVGHRSRQVAIERFDRRLAVRAYRELLGVDADRRVADAEGLYDKERVTALNVPK